MTANLEYYHSVIKGQKGVGPALLRWGLLLASGPYGLATRFRNMCFDRGWMQSVAAPVPVVSVGNLTVGGTGKTPCVEYVARYYRQHAKRVAILSRGYGTESGPNDEARVLEENLPDVPHLQGANRAALAEIAVEELESEILVLDDGFQHRRLQRDLDIVLIDATDPWGQGYLLPRGLLRESRKGLRRAQVVVLTRCDQVEEAGRAKIRQQVASIAPRLPMVETCHRPEDLLNSNGETTEIEELKGRPVAAFCGIGNPEAFRQTLLACGASSVDLNVFNDHHPYDRSDVEALQHWASRTPADALIVTTQKDLVKLRIDHLGSRPLWALRIRIQGLFPEAMTELDQKLETILR